MELGGRRPVCCAVVKGVCVWDHTLSPCSSVEEKQVLGHGEGSCASAECRGQSPGPVVPRNEL